MILSPGRGLHFPGVLVLGKSSHFLRAISGFYTPRCISLSVNFLPPLPQAEVLFPIVLLTVIIL